MSSYRKAVEKLNQSGSVVVLNEPPPQPCMCCRAMTPWKVLAHLGARCTPCFTAYCNAQPDVMARDMPNRNDSPKAWAYALKRREASGERLTQSQKDMWRSAMGSYGEVTI